MKELRPGTTGTLRVRFAFDPRRHAILLIGGDKTGRWREWYDDMLPKADDLYDIHLQELRDEGVLYCLGRSPSPISDNVLMRIRNGGDVSRI